MGIWNINPNDTASIDPNTGKAIFQPNDSYSEKHFTITYTEGDIKCVTTVTQNGNPCSYVYDKNNDNIPASGDDEYVFGTLSNVDGQEISVMVTNGSEFIDGGKITVENDRLIASIYKNTDNDSRDIEYKIYADGNDCGDGYSNTQNSNNCECRNLTLSPDSLSWEWERGEEPRKVVSMDYPNCITGIEQISTLSHFTAIMDTNSITIYPNEDNTSTTVYNDTLTIRYNAGTIEGCTQDISLTQGINGCDCDEETVNLSWNWNEFDTKTVTVSVEECVEGLSYNPVAEYIITNNGNVLSINPDGENEGTQNRDGIIRVQYSTGSKPCNKYINVTQGIRNCGCGDFVYTENSTKAYGNAQGRVLLGTLSNIKEGCLDGISVSGGSQTIKLVGGTTTYVNDFTSIEIDSHTNEVYGSFDYNPFMGDNVHEDYRGCGRILRYDVLMNGEKCGDTHTITQQGWRGTDNGIDRFINPQTGENVENMYPILMCSNSGEINGDTVVCDKGAYWNGIEVGDNFNLYFKVGDDTPYTEEPDNCWLYVYGTTDGGYCQIGYLNMVTKMDNNTNETRKAVFWLSSNPTPGESGRQEPVNILGECTFDGRTIRPDHGGEECALKWRYEVWQAKAGCKWCRNEEKLHYYEVPITGKCDCEYDEKSCGSYQELIIYEYNTNYLLSIYDGGFKILTIGDNKAMRLTNGDDGDCYYDVELEKDDDGNIIGIANLDDDFTCPGELDSIECVINTQNTGGNLQILQIIGEQYSLIAEFEKDSPIKLPIKMYKP